MLPGLPPAPRFSKRCGYRHVVGIAVVQLLTKPICFGRFTSALIGERRFIQSARRDSRIIVQQSNASESLTGLVEISTLELYISAQKTCLRVHPPLRLQCHDFLRNLLRLIWFME